MSTPARPAPIAFTMGDACGIGPEIIAKAWRAAELQSAVVIGDPEVMRRACRLTGGLLPLAVVDEVADVARLPPECMAVLPAPDLPVDLMAAPIGQVDARAGAAAAACIRQGVALALRGEVAALVTAPIHKEALAAAGVGFPGHTEMLQALAAGPGGHAPPVRMMLANDQLRTVLVTIHLSLRKAIDALSTALILDTLRITHRSAARWGQPIATHRGGRPESACRGGWPVR